MILPIVPYFKYICFLNTVLQESFLERSRMPATNNEIATPEDIFHSSSKYIRASLVIGLRTNMSILLLNNLKNIKYR